MPTGNRNVDAPGVGVAGIVVEADTVLLIRRARAPAAGLWSFPGGRVELGESLRDAARREILEECGLTVTVGALVDLVEVIRDDEGETHHWVVADYLCRVETGGLRVGDDASEARWATLAEVLRLPTTPRVAELAAAALAMVESAVGAVPRY